MRIFKNLEKQHYVLLGIWILINIIQSIFTHLHADEAYYWMYSQQLAWGYFDHPPMVALLVFLGDSISHSQLGVRLFMIVLSSFTIALLMNELNEKKDLFFLGLFILSFPLVHTHIGGFLALPDTPLVFFTLLFFLIYKKFVIQANLKLTLLLSFVGAAMIYSKYHAFLILGLVVLSNLKLLFNKYFWLAVAGILILLVPHLLWQINNNFPTFTYHLVGRTQSISFNAISNNIISQIAVAGPLSGFIVLYSLFQVKAKKDLYKRALVFNVIGFYIVLTIMSFWNWIEAHWTVAITPLLMLLTFPIIRENEQLKLWFKRLSLPIVILFFLFRFYLAADFIPNTGYLKLFFYKQEEKALDVKRMAGGLQVASFNNFDFPGTYQFYTGDTAIHLATPQYRYCQYDIWNEELNRLGDSLFVIYPAGKHEKGAIRISSGQYLRKGISPKFQSLKGLLIENKTIELKADSVHMEVELSNQTGRTIYFNHPSHPLLGYLKGKREIDIESLQNLSKQNQLAKNDSTRLRFSIHNDSLNINSPFILYTQTIEKNRGEMIKINLPKELKPKQ